MTFSYPAPETKRKISWTKKYCLSCIKCCLNFRLSCVLFFFSSSKSKCLLKPAEKDYINKFLEKKFPGEEFEANQQCEMEFKNGSELCDYMVINPHLRPLFVLWYWHFFFFLQPPCRFLWCTNNESGCSTQRTPWAEGTKCGQNK